MLDYDAEADRYDATRGGVARAAAAAGALRDLLPAGARTVLDVGGGTGSVSAALAAHGFDVICVEPSAGMLRHASGRLPGRCVLGSGDRLPFGAGLVDAVTFVWLLHLVPDADPLLREAARVLRPGGRVVTTVAKDAAHLEAGGDVAAVLGRAVPARPAVDGYERVVAQAGQHGLVPVAEARFVGIGMGLTPRRAERFMVGAAGVAALRALPDPDRRRADPAFRVLALGRDPAPGTAPGPVA